MAEVFNPFAAKVVMSGRLMGELYQNVLYVRKADNGGWAVADVEELAVKAKAFWEISLSPLLSTSLVINEFRVRAMAPINAVQATEFSSIAGAVASPALPGNVSFCIKANTGFAGRSQSGRVYLGGLTEGMVTENSISAGVADDLLTAFNSGWRARLSETGTVSMFPVVYSRFAAGGPRPTAVLTDIANYTYTDLVVDRASRRLPGRGR